MVCVPLQWEDNICVTACAEWTILLTIPYLASLTWEVLPPASIPHYIRQNRNLSLFYFMCVRLNETVRSITGCVSSQPHSTSKLQELAIQTIKILDAILIAWKAGDNNNADTVRPAGLGFQCSSKSLSANRVSTLSKRPTHSLWLVCPTKDKISGNSTWRL